MYALRLLVVALVLLPAPLRPAMAAPQAADPAQPPWFAPQQMFEQIFGNEGQVDEQLLNKIDVSANEERQVGRRAVDAYLASLKGQGTRVVTRGRDTQYLRQLVDKLQPMMKNRTRYASIEIYLALSDRVDARSFPGGYLVFFRGLLESAGNEAALIGIVGHELSHLDRGHHTRRIKEMKLAEQSFSGQPWTMTMDWFTTVGGALMRTWMRPFRPELEREADLDGARWSYLAGYDCREMGQLFLNLAGQHPALPFPVPEFFRSHPAGADRHRAIMDQYEKLQADRPNNHLHVGADNLRRRTVWEQ
jgi:predicted Zn-dependent protease